jgi:hypothetical protein
MEIVISGEIWKWKWEVGRYGSGNGKLDQWGDMEVKMRNGISEEIWKSK